MPDSSPPIRPKKSLGQHFLTNPAICNKIVSLLDVGVDDQIIEIGPGPGALTKILQKQPHKFFLMLEKDKWWSRSQQTNYKDVSINADAMEFAWDNLKKSGSWKLIGNLPYNVASPLIWNIVSKCPTLIKAVFMTQKEVAERLTAAPGKKSYGALSVWVQNFCQTRLEFNLAPGAFSPPPKVVSAVVSFIPLNKKPEQPAALQNLLNLCFQKRRKQLGTIFRQTNNLNLEKGLTELNIDPKKRPENLSPAQFLKLANFWK